MKQLGNLAVVCAQRPDVLMQIYDKTVRVHVGEGPGRTTLFAPWEDDDAILRRCMPLVLPGMTMDFAELKSWP